MIGSLIEEGNIFVKSNSSILILSLILAVMQLRAQEATASNRGATASPFLSEHTLPAVAFGFDPAKGLVFSHKTITLGRGIDITASAVPDRTPPFTEESIKSNLGKNLNVGGSFSLVLIEHGKFSVLRTQTLNLSASVNAKSGLADFKSAIKFDKSDHFEKKETNTTFKFLLLRPLVDFSINPETKLELPGFAQQALTNGSFANSHGTHFVSSLLLGFGRDVEIRMKSKSQSKKAETTKEAEIIYNKAKSLDAKMDASEKKLLDEAFSTLQCEVKISKIGVVIGESANPPVRLLNTVDNLVSFINHLNEDIKQTEELAAKELPNVTDPGQLSLAVLQFVVRPYANAEIANFDSVKFINANSQPARFWIEFNSRDHALRLLLDEFFETERIIKHIRLIRGHSGMAAKAGNRMPRYNLMHDILERHQKRINELALGVLNMEQLTLTAGQLQMVECTELEFQEIAFLFGANEFIFHKTEGNKGCFLRSSDSRILWPMPSVEFVFDGAFAVHQNNWDPNPLGFGEYHLNWTLFNGNQKFDFTNHISGPVNGGFSQQIDPDITSKIGKDAHFVARPNPISHRKRFDSFLDIYAILEIEFFASPRLGRVTQATPVTNRLRIERSVLRDWLSAEGDTTLFLVSSESRLRPGDNADIRHVFVVRASMIWDGVK